MEHGMDSGISHDAIYAELLNLRGSVERVHQKVDSMASQDARITRLERGVLAIAVFASGAGIKWLGAHASTWIPALFAAVL